ncbi:beta-1,4-N-acetylgalactosaminyltransferase bre-4-like [Ylistrum balloti]|uniref:beta-1,4-N-acetylgalactosaminyltransferase bre-4-like n=1 Tax=Ylistrum balloti TaxID=509963 RepID=UPI002905E02B|nr:beta-1,4-N-acetylgalactosaminyltransferase bre-4-like [Ylistrum balloti]
MYHDSLVDSSKSFVKTTLYKHEVLNSTKSDPHTCPVVPPGLGGPVSVDMMEYTEKELAERISGLKFGGTYRPASCAARHRVAIIIPYRNRQSHLRILLNNLHPFLQKQQLEYGIFVIKLAESVKFNKAIIMNIGFLEVSRRYGYQCFIFHDVDLIPENDNNMYYCPDNPRHMSVAIDKFDYELPYLKLFGGVTAMTKEHIEAVNGFSNKYFGWGGEDDDMYARIRTVGLAVTRYTSDVSTYRMLRHNQSDINEDRHRLLHLSTDRWKEDGLNTIKYKVLQTVEEALYTVIFANIDQEDKAYQMWTPKPHVINISKPLISLDAKIDEQLVKTAKELLNTDHLDLKVRYMLFVEFHLLHTPKVTAENVGMILKRILPNYRLSEKMMQKANNFENKQGFKDTNNILMSFNDKEKRAKILNLKMNLMINNFHEKLRRLQQEQLKNLKRKVPATTEQQKL